MVEGKDYKIEDGHLTIFNGVTTVPSDKFEYMNIKSLDMAYTVTIIESGAFENSNLMKVHFSNNLKEIQIDAFKNTKLMKVDFPDSLINIGAFAFNNCGLKSIKFSRNLECISASAFENNNLTKLTLPSSLKTIDKFAFQNNRLIYVEIPGNIEVIQIGSFTKNRLRELIIRDGVKKIEKHAFLYNSLERVEIPSSVEEIEYVAFDDIDIIYDGILIKKELVEKYGCDNVIKLHKILKVIPEEKVLEIPKEIIEVIPVTEEALKGYIANKKTFSFFAEPGIYKKEEYQDIFKLCFTLGLFNKPKEDNIKFIGDFLHANNLDYIHQMFTTVTLTSYKPKFKDVFMKLYEEDKTDYNSQNIIGRLYSSFEKISKYTLKRHEEMISKKNTEIKRLKELGANTIYLEQELEVLKKNRKSISYEDVVHYIRNNTFHIRKGNEELKDVANTLSVHMEQEGFDIIQDIYEESKGVQKNIPLTLDSGKHEFRYHWSKSDNPINTILGYLVGCCAKLGGAGEDIMRQSMINPDIANLILYDENNNIIGKATAYYNRKKKYILFNNAETKEIGTKGLKSAKQRQKECLEALIRGVNDAVKALKEKGEYVEEVRIGMLRNDLEDVIKKYGLEINYNNLLSAYNWRGYSGDASDVDEGQAIIYKDDEFDKNKNI